MWQEVDIVIQQIVLYFVVGATVGWGWIMVSLAWIVVTTWIRHIIMAINPSDSRRRAERLLHDCLTAEEWDQLTTLHYLEVPSRLYVGRIYRIPQDGSPVSVILQDGQGIERLCVETQDPMPSEDKVLALKLLIEGDEERYLRIANRLPPARGMVNWMPYRDDAVRQGVPPGVAIGYTSTRDALQRMPSVLPGEHVLRPESTRDTDNDADRSITYTDADLRLWFTHNQAAQRSFRRWMQDYRLEWRREQAMSITRLANGYTTARLPGGHTLRLANGSTMEGVQLEGVDGDPTQLGPVWSNDEIRQALNDPIMCEHLIREAARRAGVSYPDTPGPNDGQTPQP